MFLGANENWPREEQSVRTATYVRLSASRLGEEAPGLDRQREAIERFIQAREGWSVEDRHRFQDADISAYTGAPRPGFDDLRRAVEAGEVDVVAVWKLDRAFRSSSDAHEFLKLCRERRAHFVSASEGIDTSTPYGEVLFSIVAAMAQLESRTRSDRITAWHQQRAERGLPGGGGSRPFGFRADRVAHDPQEAREIRRAARRLLAGKATLTGIARDWNDRGVLTPTGGPWRKSTVRRLLTSARVAGLRSHNGGETYPASWKPIVTEDQRLSLLTLLDGRPGPGNSGRRYLLTGGLATCGLCGSNLIARPRGDGRRCYVCATDNGGCGKIRVLAEPFEEYVAEQVDAIYAVSEPVDEPGRPNGVEETRRQLAADEAALDDLARDRYVHRSITPDEFRAAREPLIERIAAFQAELTRENRPQRTFLRNLDDLPPAPWETPPGEDPEGIDEWREWVAEVLKQVVVKPAVRGRNFFTPERVDMEWSVLPVGGSE